MKRVKSLLTILLLVLTFALVLFGATKVYAVTVIEPATTDAEKVAHDLKAINIRETAISSFPVTWKSVYGSTITYTSDNEAVIDTTKIEETNGYVIVHRSEIEEVKVNVTVTVNLNDVTDSKTVLVTVPSGVTHTSTFNVTYDLGGMEVENPNPLTHTAGNYVALQNLSCEGFEFIGWYKDKDLTEKMTCLPVGIYKDVTVYAKWEEVVLENITVEANPNKVVYNALEEFDRTGMIVLAHYSDGSSKEVTEYTLDKTVLHGNDTEVVVTYQEKTASVMVTVNKLTHDLSGVTYTNSYIYDGALHQVAVNDLPEGVTVTLENNDLVKDATEKVVTVKFTVENTVDYNEIEDVEVTLKVEPRAITVTADDATSVYGDPLSTLGYKVTTGEIVEGDILEFNPEVEEYNNNVGVYTIKIFAKETYSNYDITLANGKYEVTKAPLTVKVNDVSVNLGANMPTFTSTITGYKFEDNESVLVGTLTYECDAQDTSVAGNFDIIASGYTSDNYEIKYENGTLTINETTLEIVVDEAALTRTYNGENQTITATLKDGENTVTGVDLTYIYMLNGEEVSEVINAGTYEVVVSFTDPLYGTGSKTVTLVINKIKLELTIEDKTSVYGDELVALTHTTVGILASDLELVKSAISLTTEATTNPNQGTYEISGEVAELTNYDITLVEGTYTITAKPIKITVDNVELVYGTSFEGELTYTIYDSTNQELTIDETTLGLTLTLKSGYVNVGNYEDVVTATITNDNYTVTSVTSNLVITARPITVTLENKTSVYGEELVNPTAIVTGGTLAYEDTLANLGLVLKLQEAVEYIVGDYAITCDLTNANQNYKINVVDGTYTVTKATITVTADDATMIKGSTSFPEFTYTVSVEGVEVEVLLYVTDSSDNELADSSLLGAGTYIIAVLAETQDTNYEVKTVSGILTVELSDEEKVNMDYNSTLKAYQSILTGTVSIDTLEDFPIVGENGSTLIWTSDNSAFTVDESGKITFVNTGESVSVLLTLEVVLNNQKMSYTFEFECKNTPSLVTYTSVFTDNKLSVGEGELAWSSNIAANSFDTNLSRGVQFGTNKGLVTITSNQTNLKVQSVQLILSTNGTGNTVEVAVNGTKLSCDGTSTVILTNGDRNKEFLFTSDTVLDGTIVISINDIAKSVYIKQIIVNYVEA